MTTTQERLDHYHALLVVSERDTLGEIEDRCHRLERFMSDNRHDERFVSIVELHTGLLAGFRSRLTKEV